MAFRDDDRRARVSGDFRDACVLGRGRLGLPVDAFRVPRVAGFRGAGLDPVDRKGMVFNPLGWSWSLSASDLSVNYVTASLRR